eukprot:TRINITY_DN34076_c0_g1_i1.p1 TRINITY_DN34076_c0_g1~~TRINITY_DN34076_c0_g1_i1.p1  ORF type:complete len:479 (-),score=83.87 TRINITY_DN34076_c0_g1_i1:26-1363(-)
MPRGGVAGGRLRGDGGWVPSSAAAQSKSAVAEAVANSVEPRPAAAPRALEVFVSWDSERDAWLLSPLIGACEQDSEEWLGLGGAVAEPQLLVSEPVDQPPDRTKGFFFLLDWRLMEAERNDDDSREDVRSGLVEYRRTVRACGSWKARRVELENSYERLRRLLNNRIEEEKKTSPKSIPAAERERERTPNGKQHVCKPAEDAAVEQARAALEEVVATHSRRFEAALAAERAKSHRLSKELAAARLQAEERRRPEMAAPLEPRRKQSRVTPPVGGRDTFLRREEGRGISRSQPLAQTEGLPGSQGLHGEAPEVAAALRRLVGADADPNGETHSRLASAVAATSPVLMPVDTGQRGSQPRRLRPPSRGVCPAIMLSPSAAAPRVAGSPVANATATPVAAASAASGLASASSGIASARLQPPPPIDIEEVVAAEGRAMKADGVTERGC